MVNREKRALRIALKSSAAKAGLGVGLAQGQLSAFQRLHDFDAKQRLQLQSVG